MGLCEGTPQDQGAPLCGLKMKWTLEKGELRTGKKTHSGDSENVFTCRFSALPSPENRQENTFWGLRVAGPILSLWIFSLRVPRFLSSI